MQRLVQTVFAAPFSWREDAAGRYGGSLRELLWMPIGAPIELESAPKDEIVSVEAQVDISLALPSINSDFVKAIVHVRNSQAGKKLRRSIRQLGEELDFRSQKDAWLEVAAELASAVIQPKPFRILTAAISIGKRTVVGSVAKGLFDIARGAEMNIPTYLGSAFFSGALGVAFDHGFEVLRNDLHEQKIRRQLEKAVEFRCTSLAMPPLVE